MVENRVGMGFAELKDIKANYDFTRDISQTKTLQNARRNHRARYRQARREVFQRIKRGYTNNGNPFML